MSEASPARAYGLHLGVIALLFVLSFLLPDYYHGLLARIMVLAVFAMGYNMLFGYVGLLSLGHAMFFAAGLYGAGLAVIQLGWSVPAAFARRDCLRRGSGPGHRRCWRCAPRASPS